MMVASPDESRFSSSVVRHLLPQANTDGAFSFLNSGMYCPLLVALQHLYFEIPAALVDDLDGENPPD